MSSKSYRAGIQNMESPAPKNVSSTNMLNTTARCTPSHESDTNSTSKHVNASKTNYKKGAKGHAG